LAPAGAAEHYIRAGCLADEATAVFLRSR
jgi:hypothetical protein